MNTKPRVRFAPSPTGPLHIGGVRTALYNYLFAKQLGGDLILRIEDTDSNRFVPGAEEYIIKSFQWLGIQFDEGVHMGGTYAPYRQSERKPLYRKYVDELLSKGLAYIAFDTPEEIEAMRARLEADKSLSAQYDAHSRMSMRNSLTMSKDELKARLDSGEQYVVRIKIEPTEEITVQDLIRGEVKVDSCTLDDKVLWKSSDGLPTYHLANIVDDHTMKITHVIRGEEWLPSAPLHVLLYRYLGWEESMPAFAHLPLLLKPDGNGKLSKRDGDRLGFPVFPLQWQDPKTGEISTGYKQMGYFPDAVINILALLGWNDGTEQELFSMEELIERFRLDRVNRSGAKFNVEKARWFNHQYLLKRSDEALADSIGPILSQQKVNLGPYSREKMLQIVRLVKERIQFLSEFWDQAYFFFQSPVSYDAEMQRKRWTPEAASAIKSLRSVVQNLESFEASDIETHIKDFISSHGLNTGLVMNALRLCLVGAPKGPHLHEIMAILGQEETLIRMDHACERLA